MKHLNRLLNTLLSTLRFIELLDRLGWLAALMTALHSLGELLSGGPK